MHYRTILYDLKYEKKYDETGKLPVQNMQFETALICKK